jgi:hypothetical protein
LLTAIALLNESSMVSVNAASVADLHHQRAHGDERERGSVAEGAVPDTVRRARRSATIRNTCDFNSEWIPRVLTSLSIRRVEVGALATPVISAVSARLRARAALPGVALPCAAPGGRENGE